MRQIMCGACGKAFMGEFETPCPRCALIDAVVPPVLIEPVLEIPGPASPLSNTLAQTQLPPPTELVRFAAPPNRIDEIARDLSVGSIERAPEDMECPQCAERIKVRAKVCRFCGYDLDEERPASRGRASSGRHRALRDDREGREIHHHHYAQGPSPGVAAVLSFFFVGLGQLYAGQVLRGFAFMTVEVGVMVLAFAFHAKDEHDNGLLVGWGLGLVVWICGIVDAWNSASSSVTPSSNELMPSRRKRWRR